MIASRYQGPATAQLQPGYYYPIVLTMSPTHYWVYLQDEPLHAFATLQQLLACWVLPGFQRQQKSRRRVAGSSMGPIANS